MVLDHLNAELKQHGLWYPVDVSTSAQATLGGMAGNNSCGSRSIAYGNMVHNVLARRAWTSDGSLHRFGPMEQLHRPRPGDGRRCRPWRAALRPEIDAALAQGAAPRGRLQPGHLPQPEREALHPDGSVNLAHLLVGSEGTLALTAFLTLQLSELPRAKVLGVVNFPTFYKAMDSAQHIVQAGRRPLEPRRWSWSTAP
jgi:FAD/FMN-containing dehydrogenase